MIEVPQDFLRENVNRYRKLAEGKRVDYAPFRLWLDSTFVFDYAAVDPADYSRDFEVMFEAQKAVNDRFYDLRDFFVDVNTVDIYYDRDRFKADHPNVEGERFLESSLANFDRYYSKKPFDQIPGVKRLLMGIDYFNKRLPKHKRVNHYLGASGCMDLFWMFRGSERFFTDLYDDPAKVKQIFDYLCERTLEWLHFAESKFSNMGGDSNLYDKVDVGEDYCAYLPPNLFDEFVVPYTGKIFAEFKGKVLCSLHTDGDMIPSGIHLLDKLGIDELMGFSPNVDIKAYRQALPNTILAGNIHPIKVMIEGTPDDVRAAAKYCFENANQDQKFVLCTGGAITAGAKPENVDAFIECAYKVVKYDSSKGPAVKLPIRTLENQSQTKPVEAPSREQSA